MAKTIIGLFEDTNDAQAAVLTLNQAVFNQDVVRIFDSMATWQPELLRRVGTHDMDVQMYAEGLQEGGSVIMVAAATDETAHQATDVLKQHNVVNITRRTHTDDAYEVDDTTVVPLVAEQAQDETPIATTHTE